MSFLFLFVLMYAGHLSTGGCTYLVEEWSKEINPHLSQLEWIKSLRFGKKIKLWIVPSLREDQIQLCWFLKHVFLFIIKHSM